MNERLLTVPAVALLCTALLATPSFADDTQYKRDTPQSVVAELHEGLVRLSTDPSAQTVTERFEKLLPLVRATHDLPYIAALTIRRQWSGLSSAQQERFVNAFERLSVMTYAARFKNAGPGTFRVDGSADAGGGRVQVTAAIVRADAADIPLEYVLHEHDGIWQIVNIVADGVSDLALKRAEYQRILSDGTIDDLIGHLLDQAAKLEQGSA